MPELDRKKMAEQYGYALAFMKQDPELWKLFNQAVTKHWTTEQFEAKFKDSQFYKTHSATYRQAMETKTTDPGTWNDAILKQRASLMDIAADMGADVSDGVAARIANDAVLYGWTGAQLRNKLAGYVDTVKGTGHFGGEAGESEDSLRKVALDMGQKLSDTTLKSWVRSIARGDSTVNDFEANMRSSAEKMYPGYADQIKRGLSVRDIANPYIETMAATLELNPANIGVFDSRVQKALKNRNADSGKAEEYSLHDFEMDVRKDPRWARTKQAQDAGMEVANQIMRDFGFMS